MLALGGWFVAQVLIEFGWAGISAGNAGLKVQLRSTRLLLWGLQQALGLLLLLALLGIPLWWLSSGGGLPAFLAISGLSAASVFLFRREYVYAALLLFQPGRRRSLPAQFSELRERMWDQGDPAEHFWAIGFWFNLSILLKFLGALTVVSAPFADRAPLPQLGFVLLLLALGLWVVDRLVAAMQREEVASADPQPQPSAAEDLATAFVLDTGETTVDLDAELIEAARRADERKVASLLQRGARADAEPPAEASDRRSALVSAATCGRLGVLRLLIAAGADLNRLSHGLNPLLAATRDSYDGRPDVVLMLLSNGAMPDCSDEQGCTALHHAALNRDPAVVQHLLDAGAVLEAVDNERCTPLGRALLGGNWAIAQLLLDAGASIAPQDAATPLVLAAATTEDDSEGVRLLLRHKAAVNAVDALGRSGLARAAEHDHASIAEVLLEAGADVNAADLEGRSPLLIAAAAGSRRVLRRLLFWKADPARTDAQGRNALHHAATSQEADEEVLELLLTLGCNPAQQDAQGQSPFDVAMAAAHWDLARRLNPQAPISAGLTEVSEASPPLADRALLVQQALRQGKTAVALELLALGTLPAQALVQALLLAAPGLDAPLLDALVKAGLPLQARNPEHHLLCQLCNQRPLAEAAIQLLVRADARCDADDTQRTPLLLLCGAERPPADGDRHVLLRLVQLLLERKVALDAVDAQGRSALVHALWHGNFELVGTLLDAGADPLAVDRAGRSALHQLVLSGRDDAELLARALILGGCDPAHSAADGSTALGLGLQRSPPLDWLELLRWPAGAHPRRALRPADLVTAVQAGNAQVVEQYLQLGVPVDGQDARGATAALHAAGRGDLALLERLQQAGAQVHAPAANGLTPLGAATLAAQHAVLRWLVEHGAAIDARQGKGLTALALAAARGDAATAQLLLELGAPAHVEPAESAPARIALRGLLGGAVPFETALPLLGLLLEAGGDPNAADSEGRGLLLLAVGAGQTVPPQPDAPALHELLQMLHHYGAELNLPDRQGRTPLHWTCRHGMLQATALLVRLGADPDLPDDLRKLPIDLAQARHRSELHYLLSTGPRR